MQKGTVSIWMSNTYKTLNIESSIKGCIGAWCPCGCPASRAKLLPLAPVSTHGCSDYLANREIIPLMDNKNWGLFQTVGDCIIISGNNTAIIKLSTSIYLFFLNRWKLIKINRWFHLSTNLIPWNLILTLICGCFAALSTKWIIIKQLAECQRPTTVETSAQQHTQGLNAFVCHCSSDVGLYMDTLDIYTDSSHMTARLASRSQLRSWY